MRNSNSAVSAAFHEVTTNTPRAVTKTSAKFGPKRAHKQLIAIALSKARRAGAKVSGPKMSNSKAF